MNKSRFAWHLFAAAAIVALVVWWLAHFASGDQSRDYPNRPIHVVVPYKAGGGSDTFVRIIQQGIVEEGLLPEPLVIINQDGGIGTIGSREVKNADPDGYKILCHHNAIITAKLAGTVDYGPEAFESIALTGEMSMVILCRGDAPYQNIVDLLEKAKESPRAVRFGANKGAPAYFTTLQLEKAWPGAEFSIVSAGGGADRYAKILGGHLEAGIFSLSEYLDYRGVEGTPPEQDVRAVAVLSRNRHESIPEIPTTFEVGVPVELTNANYWWAPRGTPDKVIEKLAGVLERAMQNEGVRAELRRLRMEPTFESGEAFERRMADSVRRFEEVAAGKPTSLPDFTVYVGLTVVGLLVWVIIETWRGTEQRDDPAIKEPDFVKRPAVAAAAFAVLSLYVAILGQSWIPFSMLSAVMVMVVGGLMLRAAVKSRMESWVMLAELALLAGFGTQFIFTEVLVTPLP